MLPLPSSPTSNRSQIVIDIYIKQESGDTSLSILNSKTRNCFGDFWRVTTNFTSNASKHGWISLKPVHFSAKVLSLKHDSCFSYIKNLKLFLSILILDIFFSQRKDFFCYHNCLTVTVRVEICSRFFILGKLLLLLLLLIVEFVLTFKLVENFVKKSLILEISPDLLL